MTINITSKQLAARNRASDKLVEVATYMDELWRSPVTLTAAEVNVLQECRDLLLTQFLSQESLRTTRTYFSVEDDA